MQRLAPLADALDDLEARIAALPARTKALCGSTLRSCGIACRAYPSRTVGGGARKSSRAQWCGDSPFWVPSVAVLVVVVVVLGVPVAIVDVVEVVVV